MADEMIDRVITALDAITRRLIAAEQRLELLSGRLDTARSIDALAQRLDELEAESKGDARPAPAKPLQLVAP